MNSIQLTQADYNLLQELLARAQCHTPEQKACHQALLHELIRARIVPASEIGLDVITLNSWDPID